MTYGYQCDAQVSPDCDGGEGSGRPMLMGQLHEYKFKSTQAGGELSSADYSPHETITICPACTLEILVL